MALRILVIEDNPTNLELMRYLLRAFGHTVDAARDGEEGVRIAMDTLPDLVLCDIALPKLDGYGVAQRLKGDPRVRHIPLVAVTALAMVGDRDRVLATGFDGYITKPIAPETFVQDVAGFVR